MRATGPLILAGCLLALAAPSTAWRPTMAHAAAVGAGPVDMCKTPDESTAGWTIIWLHGATIKVPTDYAVASNAFSVKIFEKGNKTIGFQTWMGIGGPNQTALRQVSSCKLVLGGRPSKITLLQGGNEVWWAIASWDPLPDGRSFEVYLVAQYPSDLYAMRAILWSAQFPGYDAAKPLAVACDKPAPPIVDVADVLDTGLVSMLAAQESPPLDLGSAVFEFSFDSAGGLLPLDITETDMKDATIKRVALLVGSNVKPQPPAAPRAGVKLMVTPAGLSYKAVAASACGGS